MPFYSIFSPLRCRLKVLSVLPCVCACYFDVWCGNFLWVLWKKFHVFVVIKGAFGNQIPCGFRPPTLCRFKILAFGSGWKSISLFCLLISVSASTFHKYFEIWRERYFLDIHNNVDLRIHVTVEIHLIMGMLPRQFFLQMCMFSLLALHQKKKCGFLSLEINTQRACLCVLFGAPGRSGEVKEFGWHGVLRISLIEEFSFLIGGV